MIEYDPHEWRGHLLDLNGSMVREILGRVGICVLWATAVVAIHRYVVPLGIPSTVHSLVGVALGLLLVFRTNASYDRFWEGRRQWGNIINETRNLARSSRVLFQDDPELYGRLLDWLSAYAHSARGRLRGVKEVGPAGLRLPEEEVAATLRSPHVPLAVSVRISEVLVRGRDRGMVSDVLLAMLDGNVRMLLDYLGACERIRRTPLPFVYVVHLRRALILYCFSLPFALVREFGWVAVLDTLGVAYVFFGIEEIGVEIEDPFGTDANDLPLEAICAAIDVDLESLRPLGDGLVRPDRREGEGSAWGSGRGLDPESPTAAAAP